MLRRAAAWAAIASEWLVPLYLLLATFPAVLVRHHSLTPVSQLNLIDDSWIVDAVYKAANGIWLGRDVAFTYGPLFQWLLSAPSRWIGVSLGSIFATWQTLPYLFIVLSGFLIARLLLPGVAAWRRALFLGLFVVYWSPPDLRTSYCLLAFAVFVRLVDAAVQRGGAVVLSAVVAALICVAEFLLSADSGIYALPALLLCIFAAAAVCHRGRRAMWQFLLVAVLCFGIGVLAVNAWMASPLDFRFWRSSLAIAEGYRWFEPLGMTKAEKYRVWAVLALGIVVFSAAWFQRRMSGPWTRRPVFLLAGFVLCLLTMQSGLVRSDHPHVPIGLAPMIILCGAIALDENSAWLPLRIALPFAVLAATIAFLPANPQFMPRSAATRLHQFVRPIVACPAGLQEFDQACLSPSDAQLLSSVSTYVDANTRPGTPIVIFPYETIFGFTSRRDVAGGVLQSYPVNDTYLTNLAIAGLERKRPPFGLYFPDGSLSVAIDSVPNFTRSPQLWMYLFRHYRSDASAVPGMAGLIADETRASRLALAESTIAAPPGITPITKSGTTLDLGALSWPDSGADFIKLRLRFRYPLWWRLLKPSKLALLISFDDGSQKAARFVVPPNRTTDVWFYPWDDRDLANYFAQDPAQWRPGNHPRPTRLTLLIHPFDWISVTPGSVDIRAVQAVRLDMR